MPMLFEENEVIFNGSGRPPTPINYHFIFLEERSMTIGIFVFGIPETLLGSGARKSNDQRCPGHRAPLLCLFLLSLTPLRGLEARRPRLTQTPTPAPISEGSKRL